MPLDTMTAQRVLSSASMFRALSAMASLAAATANWE